MKRPTRIPKSPTNVIFSHPTLFIQGGWSAGIVSFARPAHKWHAMNSFGRAADSFKEQLFIEVTESFVERTDGGRGPGANPRWQCHRGEHQRGEVTWPWRQMRDPHLLRSDLRSWLWRWCCFPPPVASLLDLLAHGMIA